jgi:hypothetical protein
LNEIAPPRQLKRYAEGGFSKMRMSTAGVSKKSTIKLIIAIVVSVLIVFSVFIFVGLRFLTKSMELGRQGLQYGEGKDNQACLDEALRRYVPNRNPIDQTSDSSFLSSCLISSKPAKEFCVGVPEFSVLNQKPGRDWAEAKCKEHGLEGRGCAVLFIQVIDFCHISKGERVHPSA